MYENQPKISLINTHLFS